MTGTFKLRRDGIQLCRRHLARDKTAPNQLVQLKLLGGELLFNRFRSEREIGGPDRFMRVLRGSVGFIRTRGAGVIFVAVFFLDIFLRRLCRFA